ncbi:hypothetical protein K502DRAFT_323411 [Neoconidiobolus thromboides FSU 785]|nr:hypothetical protein K502DRAFT_323411 [Neoconidiobolus thromboides FSU 785]
MISLLGCAETVLANSTQKHLSVHEILDGIMQSDFDNLTSNNAYTTLASALFTEIQKPGSKFERSGNKFTLRKDQSTPMNQTPDITLCNRRRRRTTSSSNGSFSSPKLISESNGLVKLSTSTNPPNRVRANLNYSKVAAHNEPIVRSNVKGKKKVSFALERNEIILVERYVSEVLPFPCL